MPTPREKSGNDVDPLTVQRASGVGAKLITTASQIKGILQTWFGPQDPLTPVAPNDAKGRTWEYTPGYNLLSGAKTRPLESLSFGDLRMLARNLDICALAIETRKDQMETIDWEFRVKGEPKRKNASKDPRLKILEDFFSFPDKDAGLSFKRWMRKLNDDILVIDQPAIHKVVDRLGRPYAFRIIDGATIKPLIDQYGLPPAAPNPRYQQWLYGVPAGDFSANELMVMPRNPRPDKLYGFSPVEQVYVTVNIGIRRQLLNLNRYTEGTIPEAMVSCPPDWTAEQIAAFQVWFDSLLTANYGQQSKMRFMPAGIDKAVFPKNFSPADEYDNYIAKVICYAFSLPSTWLTEKANRATAEVAADQSTAEGLMPFIEFWKEIWAALIMWGWGWTDIECVPQQRKEIDVLKQAQAEDIRIKNGSASVDEVRIDNGEQPIGQGPAVFVPAIGYVPIGSDAPKPASQESAPDQAEKLAKIEKKKLKMLPMTGHQKIERHLASVLTKFFAKQARVWANELAKVDKPKLQWSELIPVFEPQILAVMKRAGLAALAQIDVTDEAITDMVSEDSVAYAKERAAELVGMRWNGTEYVENPDPEWAITTTTRDALQRVVADGTENQISADALKQAIIDDPTFGPARAEMIARTELAFAHTRGNLAAWKRSGRVKSKESILSSGHDDDDECDMNADAGEVPIDDDFPSGDDGPPYHPNCECALLAVIE